MNADVSSIGELVVGNSASIQKVRSLIRAVAQTNVPVVVQGPTGAGKEIVAQALHVASGRRGPFVPFNVCAIADSMFEDSLFGHVRGAFTGACSDTPGYLAEANEGTILLDEIGGLPLSLQSKLLRVIETGQFRPVGGRADRRSNFRLVCATNDNLSELVARGLFRSDLLYRLRGVVITVPPLRERREDVRVLGEHFAASAAQIGNCRRRFTAAAFARLERHDWPGNVRELKHVMEFAFTVASQGEVDVVHVNAALDQGEEASFIRSDLGEEERSALIEVLERHEWNTILAAKELGVSRKTVYERLRRLGVTLPRRYHRRSIRLVSLGVG